MKYIGGPCKGLEDHPDVKRYPGDRVIVLCEASYKVFNTPAGEFAVLGEAQEFDSRQLMLPPREGTFAYAQEILEKESAFAKRYMSRELNQQDYEMVEDSFWARIIPIPDFYLEPRNELGFGCIGIKIGSESQSYKVIDMSNRF